LKERLTNDGFFNSMSLAAQKTHVDDPLLTLKTLLYQDMKQVDAIIDRHLDNSISLIPTIGRHLIYAGGKRLRPLLTLASFRLFKEEGDEALGLAAAVEFIHTATLLHDDVIDESKLRRGLLTANTLWGNQASVLVGDFLFARSFQLMIETNNPDVLNILANAAACISEGEILQLSLCHDLEATIEDSLRIIEAKTATLFAAACQVGALMGSHKDHASALHAYGQNLGMAFQIVDDILDYCANATQLGKEIGDDFREGKLTLPVILAYPRCENEEKVFFERTLIEHHQTPDDLATAIKILQKRNGLSKAYDLAATYGRKARKSLECLPNHPIKNLLADLIAYSLERQF
jgi:octaprenyl-diphosphate synthase